MTSYPQKGNFAKILNISEPYEPRYYLIKYIHQKIDKIFISLQNIEISTKNFEFLEKEGNEFILIKNDGIYILYSRDIKQLTFEPSLENFKELHTSVSMATDSKDTYTYYVRSEYYDEDTVDKIFENPENSTYKWRKWLDNGDPTLVYEDGYFIYNANTYKGKSLVKGILAGSKKAISDKNLLYQSMTRKFSGHSSNDRGSYSGNNSRMMTQYSIKPYSKIYPNNLFKNGEIWILKPVEGYAGSGISIVRNYSELKKSINPKEEYVLAKYITNPLLYDGHKFHIRVNVIFATDGQYIVLDTLNNARLALKPYQNSNFEDKDIHDTHFQKTRPDLLKFPLEMEQQFGQENMGYINEQINEIVAMTLQTFIPKSYPESKHAFEFFGYDFLVDDTYTVYLLEVNAKVALNNYDPEVLFVGVIATTERLLSLE